MMGCIGVHLFEYALNHENKWSGMSEEFAGMNYSHGDSLQKLLG